MKEKRGEGPILQDLCGDRTQDFPGLGLRLCDSEREGGHESREIQALFASALGDGQCARLTRGGAGVGECSSSTFRFPADQN